MNILEEKIKKFLKEQNISQNELAKRIECKHGHFSNIVRNIRPFSDDKIQKLAPILGVSPETIKGWIIADKYPKQTLQRALELKQEQSKKDEFIFASKINGLMQEANLNITAFSEAVGYNQGRLSQMRLGNESVSDLAIQKLSAYSGIPEDEIKCWTVADKYSIEALQTALAV